MTAKQKGFESPLKKAQAGKIGGGGRVNEAVEHYDAETQEHNDVSTLKHTDDTDDSREPMFRQTVYMPKKLARRLKIHASATDQDISGIITKLVEKYLAEEEGR